MSMLSLWLLGLAAVQASFSVAQQDSCVAGSVEAWTAEEVGDWLVSLKIDEAAVAKFIEQDIDGVALLELSDEDLRVELGVLKLGLRKRILQNRAAAASCGASQQQAVPQSSGASAAAPASWKAEMLWSGPGAQQSAVAMPMSCSELPAAGSGSELDSIRRWLLCQGDPPEPAVQQPEMPDVFKDSAQTWALLADAKVLHYEILGHRLSLVTHRRDRKTEGHVLPILTGDDYGLLDRDLATRWASKEPVILDVGGHIGITAILFKKLFPRARVISVEPAPINHFFLQVNLALNGLSRGPGGVELVKEGLHHQDGQVVEMVYNAEDTTGSSLFWTGDGQPGYSQKHQVSTVTLKTLLERKGVEAVDFMKLECVGCEYGVAHASDSSTLDRIKYVVGALHPNIVFGVPQMDQATAIMFSRGWRMQAFGRRIWKCPQVERSYCTGD